MQICAVLSKVFDQQSVAFNGSLSGQQRPWSESVTLADLGICPCMPKRHTFALCGTVRLRRYKTFFMLNSAEHEIFSVNKYENANLLAEKFSCSATFSDKELAIVRNLRLINRTSFMLSWVEHENGFITSRPGCKTDTLSRRQQSNLLCLPSEKGSL